MSELLKTIITFSAPSPPTNNSDNQLQINNNFARQLANEEVVNKLLKFILDVVPIKYYDENDVKGDIETNHLPNIDNDESLPNSYSATSSLTSIISIYVELIRKNNADFSEPHLFHTLRNKLITVQQSQQNEEINKLNESEDNDDNDNESKDENSNEMKDENDEDEQNQKLEVAMIEMSKSIGIVHLGSLLNSFTLRLKDFQSLIFNPRSFKGNIKSSIGLIKPLNFERFRICELYAELLHCSNMSIFNRNLTNEPSYDNFGRLIGGLDSLTNLAKVLSENNDNNSNDENNNDNVNNFEKEELNLGDKFKKSLIENEIIITLINLFFDYPFNPFLHNVVYDLILQILNGSIERGLNINLCLNLFREGKLLERIIKTQNSIRENERTIKNYNKPAYSGHLMLISEECVKFFENYSNVRDIIKNENESVYEDWENFVNGPLKQCQDIEKVSLGGYRPSSNNQLNNQFGKINGDDDDSSDDSDEDIGFMSSDFGNHFRNISMNTNSTINFNEDYDEDDDDDQFFNSFSFKSRYNQNDDADNDDQFDRYFSRQMTRSQDDNDDFGDFTSASNINDDDPFKVSSSNSNAFSNDAFGNDNFTPTISQQNLTPADWNRDFNDNLDNDFPSIEIPDLDKDINDAIKGLKIENGPDERHLGDSNLIDNDAPLGPGLNTPAEVTNDEVKREIEGQVVSAPKDDLVLIAEEKLQSSTSSNIDSSNSGSSNSIVNNDKKEEQN